MRTLFVLAILVPGLVAALQSRFAALLLYLWFALFRPQEWVWFDLEQFRMSLIIGLLTVVPALLTGILPNLTHPLSIGCMAFLASAVASQLTAINPAIGWFWLDFMARLMLIALLLVTLVNTKRRFLLTIAVISGSFALHSAKAGLFSFFEGGVRFAEGLGGAFVDNNAYALGCVMLIPLLIAVAQNATKRWVRYGFLAAVPLSAMTVVSTFSRSGFLALGTAALVWALLQRRKAAWLAGLCVVGALALVIVPIPKGYFDRLETIETYDEIGEESALGRLHFWRVAVDMARDRPLGVGLRNFEVAYDRYDFLNGQFGRRRSVHSSHFQVMAEQGFGGFVIFEGMFVLAFVMCLRIRRRAKDESLSPEDQIFYFTTANALIVAMVGFMVGGAFIALALNDLTWLTFALVAALDRLQKVEAAAVVAPVSTQSPARLPAARPAGFPALPGAAAALAAADKRDRL